ncbi:type II secretion system F family protein [Planifilum fimeticola]
MGIYLSVMGSLICLVFAGLSYINYRTEQQNVERYVNQYLYSPSAIDTGKPEKYQWHEWMDKLAPIGKRIELLSDPVELEDDLIKAGTPYGLTVDRLQGAKVLGALVGFSIAFFYTLLGLPFASVMLLGLTFGGYMAPMWTIRWMAKKRQSEIRYELPDFLDMMSITLQSGMGMDSALEYYVETSEGPLKEEIARLLQEIKFGVQRETAYRSLLRRTDSPELEALVQSLIQAHNLGTPVSQTFAQQADEMRRMRAEQAKEIAGKAAPKISVVGGLIITPSIVLMVFGMVILKYILGEDSPLKMFVN